MMEKDILEKLKTALTFIKNRPKTYVLSLTAEECSELAQACLKLPRSYSGWTSKTVAECRENLIEEIADVLVCITLLCENQKISEEEINTKFAMKANRLYLRWKDKKHYKDDLK